MTFDQLKEEARKTVDGIVAKRTAQERQHRLDLLEALANIKKSLETELERGVITDTLWSAKAPAETLFDYIDYVITENTP